MTTVPREQASAIHSARRPVQPRGFSASARSPRQEATPFADGSNRCFRVSMPEAVKFRLEGSQPREDSMGGGFTPKGGKGFPRR